MLKMVRNIYSTAPLFKNNYLINKITDNEIFRIKFEKVIKNIGIKKIPDLSLSERKYIYNILTNLNKYNNIFLQKKNIFSKLENSNLIINKNEENNYGRNQILEIKSFINELIDKFLESNINLSI